MAKAGSASLVAQEELLPFLLNRNSYPHRPRTVRLQETHASFVLIVPPFVYKVKKPVNFGFLNFSTLEKRRHFCEREVALNRRLSPGIYLGVVPISRGNGRFAFGGDGEVVEYAVQMRKLSENHFLDRLIRRKQAGPGDLNRIATVLKRFYEAQQPSAEIAAWGRIDRLRISTDENFRQTREFVGQTLSRSLFETIRYYTNQFYRRHKRLFASRIKKGRILDCHGDLHIEHIHVTPRSVHIYDCIEFNDRFRYIDVANDTAFLAMDLDHNGRPELARHFARQMAAALGDQGLPQLMDFYKCYRAYVRGKVESLHSVAHHAPETERRASADEARRYFQLALQYAIAGSQPQVLAVIGRIASGKSTLARALGAELGWKVYSSDYLRKKLAGFPLYERSSAAARKRLYSDRMTEQTYQRLFKLAEAELQQGRSVILDATFARRVHRQSFAKRFQRRGFTWRFLETHATAAKTKQRLRTREAHPEEISDARLEDYSKLSALYEQATELPRTHLVKVNATGRLEQTVSNALQSLASLQLQTPNAQRNRRKQR